MKNKKLRFLINFILVLFLVIFLLSITIPYGRRGILIFFILLMIALVILSCPKSIINIKHALVDRKEKKEVVKKLDLKHIDLELEDQKLLNTCPNCGFELKQTWKFCQNCGNILIEEQGYIRLLLTNPINDYPSKVKRINSIIRVPLICPICGNRSVRKEYKIKPQFYYEKKYSIEYDKNRSYLKVFFCKKHTHEMKKNNAVSILFILSFISFYISLPFIIIWVLLSKNIFPLIIAILILIGTGIGIIYIVRRNLKMSSLIRSHVFHEYYPELGAIFAVRNTSWVKEFMRNNKCLVIHGPIEDYLRNNEKLKRQYGIYGGISLLLTITTVLLSLFLSIFIHENFLILGFFGGFGIGAITVYIYDLILNLSKKRIEEYLFYYGKFV